MSSTTMLSPASAPVANVKQRDWANPVFAGLAILLSIRLFSWPVMHPLVQAGYAQDDFFYYLKVAQNIAAGHGSTFDGSTLTNGYHPLYMLLLVALSRFGSSLSYVFHCLWCVDVVCAVAIFLLTRRLLQRRGVAALLANGLSLCFLFYACRLICQQMEVSLTVPLGFAMLAAADVEPERYTPRRMLLIGALSALTFLSRLDSAILLVLFYAALLLRPRVRLALTPGAVAAFTLSSVTPVAAYLLLNMHYFHRLTPVSGAAKDLRLSWWPSMAALGSFVGINGLVLMMSLGFLVWYFVAVPRRVRLTTFERAAVPACLIFPVLHLIVLSISSDWKLWGWYSYSLRFAFVACLILAARSVPAEWLRPAPALGWVFCAVGALLLGLVHYKTDDEMVAIALASDELVDFQKTHPGKYAMGDRAGMFGFESPYPVLQTEGLMMDSAYLEHLRRQEPLRSVLRKYGVDYYVTYIFTPHNGCLEVEEPAQAGPMAPHMRDIFCEPPLASFKQKTGITLVYSLHEPAPPLPY